MNTTRMKTPEQNTANPSVSLHSGSPNALKRPTLGVFKFASCDGCQLTLLSCEDELLSIAERLEIVHFLEASSAYSPGPYDVALVEGSITTPLDRERIQEIRQQSRFLIAIGACATAGGIQALRNWGDSEAFLRSVYAHPEYIQSLSTSTAIADHVQVDFELRGCPISKYQLLEVIRALLDQRRPKTLGACVCLECKRRNTVCIAVARGIPCIGPLTQAGCGAICPAYSRGCYGCYGPAAQANCTSLTDCYLAEGEKPTHLIALLRNFNASAPEFRRAGDRLALPQPTDDASGAGAGDKGTGDYRASPPGDSR
jgi:sulfhydrogenase subunit delta